MKRVAVRTADTPTSAAPASGGTFREGQRVQHAKFGIGTILRITTVMQDQMLEIDFGANGHKKLLMAFARKFLTTL